MRQPRKIESLKTYGLAAAGAARGICEVIVREVDDRLHDRQIKIAPELGEIAVLEGDEDEFPKAA